MKNKATFDFPINIVYAVIADLVIDNANAHTKGKESYTLKDLETLKYSYVTQMQKGEKKNKVKVTKVIENQFLEYVISREKMERYVVKFDLIELSNGKTQLNYSYELDTDNKTMKANHFLVSWIYKFKQSKGFKSMAKYITMKCEEKENENDKR